MADKDGHFGSATLDEYHKKIDGDTEGGACLKGHIYNFAKKNNKSSCNYRYQCYEQSSKNADIKKYLHSYNQKLDLLKAKHPSGIATSAYETEKNDKGEDMNPWRYCCSIPVPEEGDWDVGDDGPKKEVKRGSFSGEEKSIDKGMNFTQDTWPYWNNAHHIIPKGTLKGMITKQGGDLVDLIQLGLLKAKYNINYKKNMIFLPQDKEVGVILELPRHIQLKEDDDLSIRANCTSHPEYDDLIIEFLGEEFDEIAKKVRDSKAGICESPDFELFKDDLEDFSLQMLDWILTWEEGTSLDSTSNRM